MGENVKRDSNWTPGLLAEKDNAARTPAPLKVDETTDRLKVDSNSANGAASVGSGNVTTTAGTAKKLSSTSIPCKRVIVHAVGGHIVVGASNADYTEASRKGIWLAKTQREVFNVSDVSLLFVDSETNVLCSYYYEV